jgi:hypothetical protein
MRDMTTQKMGDRPLPRKWDVRIASPRKLFRALHDFLDERGYTHEYEPLRAEPDAISGTAIFKAGLLGKSDSARRDSAYLAAGILLLPAILLTSLGIRFVRQSRYYMRTLVSIGVEGEAYLAKGAAPGVGQNEVLDVVSEVRITLEVTAGVAQYDYDIVKPTDNKRELMALEEERRRLEEDLSEMLTDMDMS